MVQMPDCNLDTRHGFGPVAWKVQKVH